MAVERDELLDAVEHDLDRSLRLARERRDDLAGAFGIDPEQIRIIAPPMGGSFGAKTFVRIEALVAALARKAQRPVKAVLDRAEEFVTLNRHPAIVRVRLGAKRDGTLVAKEVDCWVDTGAYADCGPGVATKLGYAGVGPYRIPHVRVDSLASRSIVRSDAHTDCIAP